MITVCVDELTGTALDWAVAKCEGVEFTYEEHPAHELIVFQYSTDWAQGGPIIERERIDVYGFDGEQWGAEDNLRARQYGETPLIAAMRCYVASKLGENIDIPDELYND